MQTATSRSVGVALLFVLPAWIAAWIPGLEATLAFDRSRLADGELWRLVSCHWTHWSLEHLALDVIVGAVLIAIGGPLGRRRLGAAVGIAVLAIPLAVLVFEPGLSGYRGLSGLDSTLFAFVAGTLFTRARAAGDPALATAAALGLLLFVAKTGFETATASTVFVHDGGFVPVPLAHAVGGLVGLCAAVVPGRTRSGLRRRSPPSAAPGSTRRFPPAVRRPARTP